ncbi:MAG: putative enzyme [Actinomycetia bacterium]|nr:putative enzyme [Actinomycetes bacterium]
MTLKGQRDASAPFFANLHPGDPNGGGAGRKALIAQLEESLRRLQTDGQLSGKYVRDGGAPADSRRAGLMDGPTERDWAVIDAVARVAAEIGVGSAEVALAWVRSRPAVTSTLIGARTVEQLRANLASLDITLAPEQLAALDGPSTPSLDFPAAIIAEPGPILGFGG